MENNRDFNIKQRGRLGEMYVCEYLKKHGYTIVKTNYSSRFGEVDIIAENDKFIVFTEVKTMTKNSFTTGLERITKSKIRKFTKTAVIYLTKNHITKQPRIDCAEVVVNEKDNSLIDISYIENAIDDWGYF